MKTRLLLTLLLGLLVAPAMHAFVPEPARNLSANVTGNTVTLAWEAPATPPLGYIVEASLSPGGNAVAVFAVGDTSMIVTSVPNGVFYVRVRSVDGDGVGAPSNEALVAVPNGGGSACSTPPGAPTGLAQSVAGSQVTLTWSAPASPCPATGYVIQAGSAPGLSNLAILNVGPVPSLSVNAPPGTYHVRVVATNAAGGSVASNEIVVVVP
jgi:hypothetical protein